MNKNKIIFAVIWLVLLAFVVFVVSQLNSAKKTWNSTKNTDFNIWIVWDNKESFWNYLESFKKAFPKYQNTNIGVESFSNYDDYAETLKRAFLSDKAPDIFVQNNNEKSIFQNQILWINPSLINPDDFRKNYEAVFSNDLITTSESQNEKKETIKTEFLAWIPMWYETLGIFYDMRNLRWKDLSSWAAVNDAINYIKTEKWTSLPIALGDWSKVTYSRDIMSLFFMQEWAKSLDLVKDQIKDWAFSRYFIYGNKSGDNAYDLLFDSPENQNDTDVSLFAKWKVSMIMWYPRMIDAIDQAWFQKVFLRRAPAPALDATKWLNLINYNYYVVNKNTKKQDLAFDLMKYFSSSDWQKEFYKNFSYYIPAMPELFRSLWDDSIKDWYPVKRKDFYNSSLELSSFDKKIKSKYDNEMKNILDNYTNYSFLFDNFKKSVLCNYDKQINFTNLSLSCE